MEVVVSVLAFAVWGELAYIGGFRLLARMAGVPLGGHVTIDLLSLLIGVSGSIAGVTALWAVVMRSLGRTPASLFGDPDDNAIDAAYRDGLFDLHATATVGDDGSGTAPLGTAPRSSARSDV